MDSSHSATFLALRRRAVSTSTRRVYGLDYVSIAGQEGQWISVWMHFIQPTEFAKGRRDAIPPDLRPANLSLTLAAIGKPTRAVVERVVYPSTDRFAPDQTSLPSNVLAAEIRLAANEYLDTFLLRLVGVPDLDPFFSSALLSCRVGLPSTEPLPPRNIEPVEVQPTPLIDYLAKDYDAFVSLISDRMAQMVPSFTERNPTAQSVGLMELLAYAGDYLSYRQDAVGTEAYLKTCRRRVSLQRHCQMVDYQLSEGSTARLWIQIQMQDPNGPGAEGRVLPKGTQVLTRVDGLPPCIEPPWKNSRAKDQFQQALNRGALVFETLENKIAYPRYGNIPLYTWGAPEYQLNRGATRATLDGAWPRLVAGEVVILQQLVDVDGSSGRPLLGQAVRLSAVRVTRDPVNQKRITEIDWVAEDALTADLPIALRRFDQPLSVVLGNLVLADFGRTVPIVSPRAILESGEGEPLPRVPADLTYYPSLDLPSLTFSVPLDPSSASIPACRTLTPDPSLAEPAIRLFQHAPSCRPIDLIPVGEGPAVAGWGLAAGDEDDASGRSEIACGSSIVPWSVRNQLLDSGPWSRDFVVEMDNSRIAFLRFGNGSQGRRPAVGTWFTAVYRIGGGVQGNIGSHAIGHVVTDRKWIAGVDNPLAADGGVDPQTTTDAKLDAPGAYLLKQPRCVTCQDYVTLVERSPEVMEAVTLMESTGSWRTAFVYVRREVGLTTDRPFLARVAEVLKPCQMAGTDLEVSAADELSLDIALRVTVERNLDPQSVYRALMGRFSDVLMPNPLDPDSGPGFFYPGILHMGETMELSRVIQHAVETPGVAWVEPTRFQPWAQPQNSGLAGGAIQPRPFEVVRVANDPTIPANGRIEFEMDS